MYDLKYGLGVVFVGAIVDSGVGVNVAFGKYSGKSEPVVAVDEVMMYIVDLGGDVVEVDDNDELNELNVDNWCKDSIVVNVDMVESVWWYTVETIDLTR